MMTLRDLNDPAARASVRTAPIIVLVSPHTGLSRVAVGQALVDEVGRQSGPDAGVPAVRISIEGMSVSEPESHELELALAAIVAIRGSVDSSEETAGVRPLANVIAKYWHRGQSVPWTEMLTN